jgi:PAS domain S-box-containing protein
LVLTQAGLTLTIFRLSNHAGMVEIWVLMLLSAVGPLTLQHVALRRRPPKTAGGTSHWVPLILEQAGPYILITLSGVIMRWNGRAEELLGWSSDEVLGRPLVEILIPPERQTSFHREFRRVSPSGRIRVQARHGHGHIMNVELRITLLRSSEATAYALFLTDLTERMQLDARMHALQKLEVTRHVAGGLAHDLNNMLLVIGSYSDLLKQDPSLGGSQREGARQIGEATKRAADLTGRLLAFSRQEAVPFQTVYLNDLITSLEPMLRPLLGERIDLVSVLEPTIGCLHADPVQIERVLINLSLNARDAMPEGGRLLIMTERLDLDEGAIRLYDLHEPGPYVRLVVRDTGIGMDADTLSHAFDRFFTTKPKGQGTGLGLTSVRDIVAESRGVVTITSEPGLGTSVHVYLPLVASKDGVQVVDGGTKNQSN